MATPISARRTKAPSRRRARTTRVLATVTVPLPVEVALGPLAGAALFLLLAVARGPPVGVACGLAVATRGRVVAERGWRSHHAEGVTRVVVAG